MENFKNKAIKTITASLALPLILNIAVALIQYGNLSGSLLKNNINADLAGAMKNDFIRAETMRFLLIAASLSLTWLATVKKIIIPAIISKNQILEDAREIIVQNAKLDEEMMGKAKKLEEKIEELKKFKELTINRELRMMQLKDRLKKAEAKAKTHN